MTHEQKTIYTQAEAAYRWASNHGERFPEAEPYIAKHPEIAYCYANEVIKGRWPEAEATIAGDPECSRRYLQAYPDAREDWILNGWLDWLDT